MRKSFASLFLSLALTTGMAADISGTWRGVLASDGESGGIEVLFSPAGYPIYTYTNNGGVTRQVELTQAGQIVEYVPPGGGVQRIVVESIDKQPTSVMLTITGSFERSRHGYLDQQQESTVVEYALIPEGLRMRVQTRNTVYLSDKEAMAGGTPSETVAEGILQRAK
jgi:hypothetical protein